jgi:AsmA family/AsmA-like C-terminal region
VKTLLSRRIVIAVGVLLLVLFLIRPGADRLRWRITQSISQALGRKVNIGYVHLRFLPRPGFEFENLVIHDDPAFGAEPLLRAPDVTAWVRIMPLFRGRIEIATLDLDQASLNLTRDPQGKWNLEDLLERTSRISTAPTTAENLESRPAFPYIEASQARINFKIGTEKTHFAFTDARFALWQESENSWGVRLKALPIRTDANLTDTGVITVSGMWQRSAALHETPVQISFAWKQAQIGQVSELLYGSDQGWRGNVVLFGAVVGTPGKLRLSADASVDNFRRYDVLGNGSLRLVAHCAAEYSSQQKLLSNVDCNAPAGDGSLELKGSASGLPFSSYDFVLVSSKVPAQSVLSLARHSRPGMFSDVNASGILNATVHLSREDMSQPLQLRADGKAQDLRVGSPSVGSQIALGEVPFSFGPPAIDAASHKIHPTMGGGSVGGSIAASIKDSSLEIGPVSVVLGRPAPLHARASLSLSGYQAAAHGDAGLKQLLQSARVLGVPAPAVSADGSSTVDLTIAGSWADSRPKVLGTAQLRSVRAQVRGLSAPLDIVSANLVLDDNSVRVQNLNASAAQATWRGSLQLKRPCSSPGACEVQFNLRTAELAAADLNDLLNPSAKKQSWYKFLARDDGQAPYLLQASATGKITVDKLDVGKSTCTQVTADLDLHAGKLKLANLKGQTLGGKAAGEWQADFSVQPPAYSGSGSFDGASLTAVAALMHNAWIDGTGAAKYDFTASGWTIQDLLDSANLTGNFAVRDSSFPHIALTSQSGVLHASSFSGKIAFQKGQFSFPDAKLESPSGVYKVSGTVSLNGGMNLKMTGEGVSGFALSGNLLKTRVAAIPTTAAQASLKP